MWRMNEAGLSKLKEDWLKWLKGRLDEGEWLRYEGADAGPGALDSVLVDLNCQIGLLYRRAEGGYFQIFLHPDGTRLDDVLWSGDAEGEDSGAQHV